MTKEYTHVRLEMQFMSYKIHADKDKKSISRYLKNYYTRC